ncbi:flagellar basal-body rod protein FlgG [Pseudoalteromonas sp. BMB]|uniref:flagellar basal-body rod protein FlgG n=1 Tax=Pseudoalteromonas sp. BMB TaxID=1874619 RepID=UPI00083E40F1|nr:flagellar basal-body rod protein FlgG [Pseudoalteromonas sp. BMB]ODB37102.1 flagellar basal-body rod protein FlgG [Pseudoalteromonas sp. BMB]
MIEALYIAETGMNSQQELIEVISNNIANVSTPGFKSAEVNFVDLVYQTNIGTQGFELPAHASAQGIGVSTSEQVVNFERGDLKQTGNPFDIAINGNGFLAIETQNGELAYTRAGRLRVDDNGYLVSTQGQRLSANIQLPPDVTGVTFTSSGSVLVRVDSASQLVEIGQLELVNFNNPQGLNRIGNNLYQATEQAGQPTFGKPGESGLGQIVQGFTELSNVSMNEEMVNLMLAQRGYQLNARIIQVSDQVLETINNLRR